MNPEPIGIAMVLQHFTDKYLVDNAKPRGVEREDSGPGNNLSGGVESRHATERCEVSNKRSVGSNAEMLSAPCVTDKGGQCTQRSTHSAGGPVRSCASTVSGSSAPPAQNFLHQEAVIEVKRYGENGEPLFVQVLGCASYPTDLKTPNHLLMWTAYPEAEVVETNGDYRVGEVIRLSPEEQLEVAIQAEREWLND